MKLIICCLFIFSSLSAKTISYVLNEIQNDKIILSGNSEIQVGKSYRSDIQNWKKGERLKFSYNNIYTNNIEIINLDRKETAWGTLLNISDSHSIIRLTEQGSKIVLRSGYAFKTGSKGVFTKNNWTVNDCIFIFSLSDTKFTLYNAAKKQFISGCYRDDHKDLLELEDRLNERVLSQEHATNTVTATILNYFAGLKNPKTPIAVFLFLGQTGVGKTELAKVICDELYKDPRALIRFDMSHFAEEWTATRLIGSAPGYVDSWKGGDLTNALMRMPRSVVLLDEIEKAHPKIRKIFLPIFDEGYVVDSMGHLIKCNEVIFIMTSNMCSTEVAELFRAGYSHKEVLEAIEPMLMRELSPELYNRIVPILFSPFNPDIMEGLTYKLLNEVIVRIKESRGITLIVDSSVTNYLIENGFHPLLGARPLKALIEKKVVSSLAYALLNNEIEENSTVIISYSEISDSWKIEPYSTLYI